MKNMFLFGISGKMGKVICDEISNLKNFQISGGIDLVKSPSYPTFSSPSEVNVPLDVIVDFTRPETLDCVISLAENRRVPVVIATTGYDEKQMEKIHKLATKVPVFFSGNMSLGINVLLGLVKRAASVLSDWDIEIIEKHHNQKVDAPSGTAKMIANAASLGRTENLEIVSGRAGASCKRKNNEISISSIRGGTIVGEHEIMFCGEDEFLTISHTASSRKILAKGAIKAAEFILAQSTALYDMESMLKLN